MEVPGQRDHSDFACGSGKGDGVLISQMTM